MSDLPFLEISPKGAARGIFRKDNSPETLRPRGNYLYDKGENDELLFA